MLRRERGGGIGMTELSNPALPLPQRKMQSFTLEVALYDLGGRALPYLLFLPALLAALHSNRKHAVLVHYLGHVVVVLVVVVLCCVSFCLSGGRVKPH